MGVRRYFAQRKLNRSRGVWPIDEASGHSPKQWPGWPDQKKFSVVLTHDVEGRVGLEKCAQLAALEEELGFRSSFNFIPEGGYSVPEELRSDLENRGFEIGVHDLRHDGKLYKSERAFEEHAQKINHYLKKWNAVGFRSGFMLRNLDWLHKLDTLYDASTFDTDPFEPQPDGARTIFPFWIPRHSSGINVQAGSKLGHPERSTGENANSGSGYVELPYTLGQDSTLFLVLQEKTIEVWKRKVDWLIRKNGMILVNVHPDYIDFSGKEAFSVDLYPVRMYRELLEYLKSKGEANYWHALPREVAEYYKQNMVKENV